MEQYVDLLYGWNNKLNLISRKDVENIWTRHILGSVSFLFRSTLRADASVVDIGTGGGLPGIPIAILRDDLRLLLVDSIQKKIMAVRDILSHLKLQQITAVAGRAEDLSRSMAYSGKYDYVIARAVAPIADLIKWGKPFLKKKDSFSSHGQEKGEISSGSILMLKGGDLSAEIQSALVKCNPHSLDELSISIDVGEANQDLFDKKLVIVQP